MNGRLGWSTLLTPPILMPMYVESRFAGKACNLYFQTEYKSKDDNIHTIRSEKLYLRKNVKMKTNECA